MASEATVKKWFEEWDDEYLLFGKIAKADKLHPRPDICALMYLHNKCSTPDGQNIDAISGAEHDEIHLAFDTDKLTKDDVLYVRRCGVRLDEYGLCMFV